MGFYLKPRYEDDADYTTNAPSYYDDLARKNELLKKLSKRIWEYDEILASKLTEIDTTMKEYQADIDVKVDNSIQTWLDTNIENVISEAIQMVWFGLNDEGYFIASIPESWNEIQFDTNVDGQLILIN